MSAHRFSLPSWPARRLLAAWLSAVGCLAWTHGLAGMLRALAGLDPALVAPASWALSLAAVLAALAGSAGSGSAGWGAARGALSGFACAAAIAITHPIAFLPALALVPAGSAAGALGRVLARRLPARVDGLLSRHPRWAALWVVVALLALVQFGRLSTYMSEPESDWFLSTRHPFYAKHECANAYVFAAELQRRGEPNVYDARHYPGLNPEAAPSTAMTGMTPEDPFQYPPPFLLLPRLAIELTSDYGALRTAWFAMNATLCLGAVLALALWVGGAAGAVASLATPLLLTAFPVLHDFQYGQFHFAAVALAVLGMLAFQRGRAPLGGMLLAGAIAAKLFPLVLLPWLVFHRRWRALAWTTGAGVAITALAWIVLGSAPFAAFFSYHLPRLSDGSAFAFGEAWPEVAMLVTAGNQGVHGIVHKLGAMGLDGADAGAARSAGTWFSVIVLALAAYTGRRAQHASRSDHARIWLGLMGLASLASAGAWADYVPLTCVWLLAYLLPGASGRPFVQAALVVCAAMQWTLIGTMPIGGASDASWMLPLSLLGAVAMGLSFGWAALAGSPEPAWGRALDSSGSL